MLYWATSKAVEPVIVVLRIDTSRIEVQIPAVSLGVERATPVVTVPACVVPRRTVAVA